MQLSEFNKFTEDLVANLERDPRVLGLVAVGSMAGTHNQPDARSDHDFLIVTAPGAEEDLRTSTAWLPKYRPSVLNFRETAHGVKILYDDGHLLEYAIFNKEDFRVVKINSFRILIDRGGFAELVYQVLEETKASSAQHPSDEHLFGQFLTHLLVGIGRHARGEVLSGARFVKQFALDDLLSLLTRHVPIEAEPVLDSIDRTRRFERAYPALGAQLNQAISLPTPDAAIALLNLAADRLEKLNIFDSLAAQVVRKYIESSPDESHRLTK